MDATTPTHASSNGHRAATAPPDAADAIGILRTRSEGREVLGGFGPLVVAGLLLLVMVLLVPSVAPEQVVEQPAGTSTDAGEVTP